MLLEVVPFAASGGQLGAHGEQLALQPEQTLGTLRVGGQRPGQAQRGHGFVEAAVRLGVEIVLGNAAAVEQPGLTRVAAAGDDRVGHAAVSRPSRLREMRPSSS